MAKQNPRGSAAITALSIPTEQRKFLRGLFTDAREGIRDDLCHHAGEVRDRASLGREEAAYEALLAALTRGWIVVDSDVRCVLCDLAMAIDRANEYERVVAEHAALLGIRRQVWEGANR